MRRKGALAVLGIVVAVAVLGAIGVVAYNMGVTNAGNGGHPVFGPMMRGYRGGFGMYGGDWVWGIIPAILFVIVIFLVLVALLGGSGRGAATVPSGSAAAAAAPGTADPMTFADAPAGLRELVEMHDRGALTDDEFAAAKRKLLGM
jgi:hypothetical protein